ncbi:MAG: hypothetical protein ACM3PE_07520 [Deltaproteobacteria bacterium]
MPTNVKQLFIESGKEILGQESWGQKVNCKFPGIYVIAMTHVADTFVCSDYAPISEKVVQDWINYVPKLMLDGERPRYVELTNRLKEFWIPDETILYIGKAGTSLESRVSQYYKTKLGDPKPHAGGHWIKTLENLNDLSIFWTTSEGERAQDVENKFLKTFIENVSNESKQKLLDPEHPFPFANLEFPKGTRKGHGLQYQVNK